MQNPNIVLEPAKPEELAEFCRRLQKSFTAAVQEKFGESEPIPSDREVWQAFEAPNAKVYQIMCDGQKAGGVVLSVDEQTLRNSLDLFFIDLERRNQGLGFAAWQAIEALYPQTKVWETGTPYFERRNIHFYVNKCGFHVVEFFNERHPDPHAPELPKPYEPLESEADAFFRFEKVTF